MTSVESGDVTGVLTADGGVAPSGGGEGSRLRRLQHVPGAAVLVQDAADGGAAQDTGGHTTLAHLPGRERRTVVVRCRVRGADEAELVSRHTGDVSGDMPNTGTAVPRLASSMCPVFAFEVITVNM